MRSLELALQLIRYRASNDASSDSMNSGTPSDDELYLMSEGTTKADITAHIRQQTEKRYAEWAEAKSRAGAVRQMLDKVVPEQHDNDEAWREAVDEFRAKYDDHRRACATRLPRSVEYFDRGRRWDASAESYRRLLLTDDPVQAVAEALKMTREEVEARKLPPQDEYLEWTFLARVIPEYTVATRSSAIAKACVAFTVHLIDSLIEATYRRTFAKTKITGHGGSSSEVSLFSIDIEELAAMVRHLQSGHADPRKLLKALELIWHVYIPDADRQWLQMDPRDSVTRLLAPPPPPPPAPPREAPPRLPRPPPKRARTSVGFLNTLKPREK